MVGFFGVGSREGSVCVCVFILGLIEVFLSASVSHLRGVGLHLSVFALKSLSEVRVSK